MARKSEGNDHWTKMIRQNMETPAWRALSPTAQAAYLWIKLEWKGPRNNNNGRIALSARTLAEKMGCNKDTASRALQELQRKGWIVVTKRACLGVAGAARGNLYEITEIACPPHSRPRNLFRDWDPDNEFPVASVTTNNPLGRNGK